MKKFLLPSLLSLGLVVGIVWQSAQAKDAVKQKEPIEAEAKASHPLINAEEPLEITGSMDYSAECQSLLARDKEWTEATASDNVDLVCSFWSKDAIFYFPDGKFLAGIEEIRRFVESNREKEGFKIIRSPVHAYVSADGVMGITQGVSELSHTGDDGKAVSQNSRYTNVWRLVHGKWRCVISSSD